jgi:DNA topoisomerase-1
MVAIGQYGSYVKCGPESRNVEDWRQAITLSIEDAMALLAQPKGGRAARGAGTSVSAIHDFGPVEGLPGPVRVLPGRFGPYVTDGKTNATIPKSVSPETITLEQAVEMIKAKMAAGPSTFKRKKPVKRSTAKKK